jgi:hypothetical protein
VLLLTRSLLNNNHYMGRDWARPCRHHHH